MSLDEAIKYALNGEAVLFCGSGFSTFASNQNGEELKTAKGLCEKLISEGNLEFEGDDDIEFISQQFINSESKDKLIDLLQREYIISSYDSLYEEISKINWRRIYTTNYDDLLEQASSKVGIARVPVTLANKPSDKVKQNKIIHLNGYIKNLDKNKLDNEFKLLEKSYITTDFLNSGWSEIFRNDIRNAKAVIFIGYSMKYDLDIKRIILNNNKNKSKIYFINGNTLTKKQRVLFSSYGINTNIGVKEFVEKVREIQKIFKPIEISKDHYDNFRYYNNEEHQLMRIEDGDILDLFIYGKLKLNHIRNSPFERKYFLKREKISLVLEELKYNPKVIVITSDMANGKTCFIKSLIQELINSNYNVFEMDFIKDNLIDEFEHISKNYDKKCLIIDNYHLFIDKIKKFQNYVDEDITYIVTSRTLLNDMHFHNLSYIFSCNDEDILNFDINRLTNNEINKLIEIFEEYNLWGEYSAEDINIKRELLIKKFKCKFQNILIGVLESNYIKDEVEKILSSVQENISIKKIMLASFINYIIGINLKVDELVVLLKRCKINGLIRNNTDFRELIDIAENEFKVKSALLANYIINKKGLKKEAIEVLIEMAEQADKYSSNKKYEKFLRIIISFSNIQFLLKSYDSNIYANNIISYYDRIKNLNFNRENPYFWFQYAIARLELKQYPEAKNYFDSAYSYAKKQPGFDTLQLDTHYARYLLENQIENGTFRDAFEIFAKAHNYITVNRINKTHYHYPLRQSIYYYDYYNKFYNKFSEPEKAKFMLMCSEILDKANHYKKSLGRHRTPHPDVIRCEENIRKLLAEIRMENVTEDNIGYIKKNGLKRYFGFIKTNGEDIHFKTSECDFKPKPYDLVEFKFVNNPRGGTAKDIKVLKYVM